MTRQWARGAAVGTHQVAGRKAEGRAIRVVQRLRAEAALKSEDSPLVGRCRGVGDDHLQRRCFREEKTVLLEQASAAAPQRKGISLGPTR